jgi:hypothetical protein
MDLMTLSDGTLQRLMDALRARDGDRLASLVPLRGSLPSSLLSPDTVPAGAPWAPFGLLQAFALTFDGYAHCESPAALLTQARETLASTQSIAEWHIDDLRAALFALQREFHDAWGDPDPALVRALVDAILDATQRR